ncbi:hypothetical protein [Actinomadura chibensis]|uniref:Uncharacterized protein n=1 Tax=Actinomadura chibensis TaxID=392828 RepID=A0A5D0NEP3_9ACTN|nr:hypothetical protein [Actinomadura chibensis]TYB42842.1 hypothetical protein FXF69_29130 [Actinomadura chibensis]
MPQSYGRLDPLYDAVRARAPQVDAACVHTTPETQPEGATPTTFMRVGYGHIAPRRVVWDDDLAEYLWATGPDTGARLGSDPEQAADRIAQALGAPLATAPAAE